MHRLRHRLAPSLAVGLALAAAAAGQAAARPTDIFYQADRNHDGQVTLAEMKGMKLNGFKRLDVDHNGVLTSRDVSRWAMVMGLRGAQERWDQFRADFDTDGDGRLTRTEFVDSVSPVFRFADRDGDGVVTAAEREAALASR